MSKFETWDIYYYNKKFFKKKRLEKCNEKTHFMLNHQYHCHQLL